MNQISSSKNDCPRWRENVRNNWCTNLSSHIDFFIESIREVFKVDDGLIQTAIDNIRALDLIADHFEQGWVGKFDSLLA
jgi:hypothetical protein